jgi:hypothetical protein
MTEFILPRRHNRILSAVAGFGKSISQLLESVRAGLDARDAFSRYDVMSDAELARRGLKREEIPYVVMRRYLSGGS